MRLVGVDGCRNGWVAAIRAPDGGHRTAIFPSFRALSEAIGEDAIIAIDIPIGLPERSAIGGRGPERVVRPLLGERQSSVFSIPSRRAVYAGDDRVAYPDDGERYRHACAVARETCDGARAVSKQGFYIFGKIAEVDRRLREGLPNGQRVVETHPEVAFWAMNGDRPLPEPKKVKGRPAEAGLELRRTLLVRAGIPLEALAGPRLKGAGLDDVIDAFAGLVVADAFARGAARSFPSRPGRDEHGLEVAIWAGPAVDVAQHGMQARTQEMADQHGFLRKAAEHALRYRETVASGPQRSRSSFLERLAAFREPLPEAGSAPNDVVDRLVQEAEPGLHAMTGPRFFGWVIGGSHPVGVAADWLTSAWGQNAGNHQASPAAAAVEAVAGGWLLDLLDLPRDSSIGFVTGATVANFVCLAAARGEILRKAGWDVEANGLFGAPPITVLIGDDAHTTVFSALQFLGLGHGRVVRIATDSQGRIDAGAFARAAEGATGPAIAILQAGQINTGAFDPFEAVVPLARKAGAWIHVDGAFGLWARASPRYAPLARGVDGADSWVTDGHKWLQTPYDCGYAIVRNEEAHRRAMTIAASYLPAAQEGERDPTHFVPELSRRARGFASWAMLKHLGRAGVAALVEQNCAAAHALAQRLRADPSIRIVNEVALNQVIVRFGADEDAEAGDRLTRETIARIQTDGVCFAGGALWRGRQVMRVSVSNWATDVAQADIAAEAVLRAFTAVKRDRS